VTELTDYLDAETLSQLTEAFSRASGGDVKIYCHEADGADAAAGPSDRCVHRPIIVADRIVGAVELLMPDRGVAADPHVAEAMADLLGEMLKQLCAKQQRLRERVDELAAIYRLTAVFTEQRDLPGILDTVVRTVVEVMGVKACGLRLLDPHSGVLVVEAAANLSEAYLNKGEILLADSKLDTEALHTGQVVYVADERTDPRVLYPQEARREGIVSALIVPLLYKGGPIGALRLYTARRYEFSDYEVALIRAIAGQAAAAIVNARLYAERRQAEQMRRQVQLAVAVQRRMIPAEPPRAPGVDIAAVYVPSLELSGDFYDFIPLPEDNLGLVICDVMGKGIPAALLTASIRAALRAHAGSLYDLSEILRRINRGLCEDTLAESFATLFYGVLSASTGRLTYANAGHEPPLLIRAGEVTSLSTGGVVLGITPDAVYEQAVLQLQADDVIFCTTDGLIEAMNFHSEQFGRRRTRRALLEATADGRDANGIARHVLWEMRRFAGLHDRDDDVTLVTLRVEGSC